MSLYGYILFLIDKLKNKKYLPHDMYKYEQDRALCEILSEMSPTISAVEFCDTMAHFYYCPSTFEENYPCFFIPEYTDCCYACWFDFLCEQLKGINIFNV